jgi:zinc transport system permease protein
MNLLSIFQYTFMLRAFEAGILVAIIAPIIGIFLVLRRLSLIADTLAHVSLSGIALGLLLHIHPLAGAFIMSIFASLILEPLLKIQGLAGDSILSLLLSGSLGLAVLLLGVAHGFSVDLFTYLFGSLLTVTQTDVYIITALSLGTIALVYLIHRPLLAITFDEESARVVGIPTRRITTIFLVVAALTITAAIPVVGILLISALLVIPVLTALLFRQGFVKTLVLAEIISVTATVVGIIISYYANLPTGGTIVAALVSLFTVCYLLR